MGSSVARLNLGCRWGVAECGRVGLEDAGEVPAFGEAVGEEDEHHADESVEEAGGGGEVEAGLADADAVDEGLDGRRRW